MPDVVVIGAGIAGLSLSVELRSRGAAVTVVDSRYPGGGNSGRNVGRLRRMQLTPDLTDFAVHASNHWELLDRLAGGRNPLLYPTSYVWVFYEDHEREVMEPMQVMWASHGARARLVSASEVLRTVSILEGGEIPVGGVISDSMVVHHDAAIYALFLQAKSLGVKILTGETVVDALSDGSNISGVLTSRGNRIRGDVVVNAAGAKSPEVAALLGAEIPNRPIRREVFVTEPRRPFMRSAVVFYRPQEGWFNQTLRGELVAGVVDPDEPLGFNESSSLRFVARTARVLVQKAPRLAQLRVVRQWAGCYDWTPDKRPLVGFHASRPGVYEINGWSGRGMLLGPLSGKLAALEILGHGRDPRLGGFDADRFVGTNQRVTSHGDYYASYAGAKSS